MTSAYPEPEKFASPLPLVVGAGIALLVSIIALLLSSVPSAATIWLRWLGMMAVAWWLPGLLLVALMRLPAMDRPTMAVLAVGTGWCWLVFGVLLAHWWPGEIKLLPLVVLYTAGAIVLTLMLWWRPPLQTLSTPRSRWGWLLCLVVLASVLRLPGLGYHEFHYDEVLVLTRAREAIRGEDDAFARHTKGPGELAAATIVYTALGTVDETTARLPFALLSVTAIAALALLGLRLVNDHMAFWSGVLLAANGFALGLSRIIQYQAAILLLMILAVLAGWEFARSGQSRWVGLAMVFGAFGTIMHYEFVLIAPALLWLLWLGWQQAEQRTLVWTLSVGGLSAFALGAAVYLPALLHPFFSTTQGYLDSRLGTPGRTANLAFFAEMGTFYNSAYFFVGLLILVGIGLWSMRRRRSILLLLLLWFIPYLLLYLFVVEFPGTHWYILMPAWSLLAAVPIANWTTSSRTVVRTASAILVTLWLILSVNYLHLLFFRQEPEYLVNYAIEREPFYWAPYGLEIPEKPRFGFPVLQGWKTLGVLSEWKYLAGTYASNERSRHVRWYGGDFERVPIEEDPDFVFVARHLQEPDASYSDAWLDGYRQIGEVTVREEPRIEIWSRDELPAPFISYSAADFDRIFMGQAPTFEEWPDPVPTVRLQPLGDELLLIEAGVDRDRARAGDLLHLMSIWQPLHPLTTDYKLFVHIAGDDGVPLAQWDGYPQINTARTSTWEVDSEQIDRVLLRLPDDIPSGDYRVLVGLYDPVTGGRLGNQAIEVSKLEIR